MPYIIDGHNLIPKIPGLSLASIDDEIQLIKRLQVFNQKTGKKIDVYFDNAPQGSSRTQRFGSVTAHFVCQGSSADAAIGKRLENLGREASTWTVVSSDRQIQAAARSVHARVIKSEDFASELLHQINDDGGDSGLKDEINLSTEEVDEWLKLFNRSDE